MLGLEILLRTPKSIPYSYQILYRILDDSKRALTDHCQIKSVSAPTAREAVDKIAAHVAKQKSMNPILDNWKYVEICSITMNVDVSDTTSLSMQDLAWIVEGLRHISDRPGVQKLHQRFDHMLNLIYDMKMETASRKGEPIPIRSTASQNWVEDIRQKLKQEWDDTGNPKTLDLLVNLSKWVDQD